MNRVTLAGRLVADPESIITKTGATVCRISVACNDISGRKDDVYFFPCVAWESRAKFISTYLKKGSPVVIDGRLQRRSYVNSEGNTVYNTEVLIDHIRSFGSTNSSTYVKEVQTFEKNDDSRKSSIENLKNESIPTFQESKAPSQPHFQDDTKNEEEVIEDFDLDWLDDIDD